MFNFSSKSIKHCNKVMRISEHFQLQVFLYQMFLYVKLQSSIKGAFQDSHQTSEMRDVFKGFTKLKKSTCIGISFWENSAPQLIQKILWHWYFLVSFSEHFFWELLRMAFYWSGLQKQTTCSKEIRKDNSSSICQPWNSITMALLLCTSKYLLLLKEIWFPRSLTFPHDLYWWIKFQILCDQTINSSLRAKASNNLTCIQIEIVRSLGPAIKYNLCTDEGSSEKQKFISFDSGFMWFTW